MLYLLHSRCFWCWKENSAEPPWFEWASSFLAPTLFTTEPWFWWHLSMQLSLWGNVIVKKYFMQFLPRLVFHFPRVIQPEQSFLFFSFWGTYSFWCVVRPRWTISVVFHMNGGIHSLNLSTVQLWKPAAASSQSVDMDMKECSFVPYRFLFFLSSSALCSTGFLFRKK